jgi:hypothetical protein
MFRVWIRDYWTGRPSQASADIYPVEGGDYWTDRPSQASADIYPVERGVRGTASLSPREIPEAAACTRRDEKGATDSPSFMCRTRPQAEVTGEQATC